MKNIRKNLDILGRSEVDAILVDCATCGAALKKEYVHILEELGEDVEAVRSVAKKVLDIWRGLLRSKDPFTKGSSRKRGRVGLAGERGKPDGAMVLPEWAQVWCQPC